MTKDNHFQQYGYDHYLQSPKRPRESQFADESEGRFRFGPGAMTLALLLTGAVFATVIVTSYPSSDKRRGEIPIVKADLRPVKSEPEDREGLDIPNRESTILARVGEAPVQGGKDDIENLLESPDEGMMSRDEAIQSAMAEAEYRSPDEDLGLPPVQVRPADVLQKIEEPEQSAAAGGESMPLHEAGTSPETRDFVRNALEQAKGVESAQEKPALEITGVQIKSASSQDRTESVSDEPGQAELTAPVPPVSERSENVKVAQASVSSGAAKIEDDSARAASSIEPAAGMAPGAAKVNVLPGTYYVQLASVRSSAGTSSEWAKLQKKFGSLLGGLQYRVQEASLGERGTFYRIQAGPMSKESANEICGEIKAQSPNGCLVVKK